MRSTRPTFPKEIFWLLPNGDQKQVGVGAYLIDETPVTWFQYLNFCAESERSYPEVQGHENEPVTGISWEDAVAYCIWEGGQLPTLLQYAIAYEGVALFPEWVLEKEIRSILQAGVWGRGEETSFEQITTFPWLGEWVQEGAYLPFSKKLNHDKKLKSPCLGFRKAVIIDC